MAVEAAREHRSGGGKRETSSEEEGIAQCLLDL